MWIGAIRFRVRTKDAPNAGTDNLVRARVYRNGLQLGRYDFDSSADDLERGSVRNYDYSGPVALPRRFDQTEELPPGVGQHPMPYPSYGFEFSNGLPNHLLISLRIHGDDMWFKDSVEVFIRELRLVPVPGSFDTLEWKVDPDWTRVHNWNADVQMSDESGEGANPVILTLPE